MDARIKFIKDPIVICSFIIIGGLGVIIQQEQPNTPQVKENHVTAVKSDTTEWRKQYYENLYHSTPNITVHHISSKVSK